MSGACRTIPWSPWPHAETTSATTQSRATRIEVTAAPFVRLCVEA